ncbi:lipoprotein [Lysobacter arvi]|uniref:Lipoprotein n=1 Tax=Lysobacter arvi TaxID=3038776 RepID=A0ABU1CHB4_9GAMM|nr:lipoprotein [Lysobacter arvi]MDR0184350.1 lipoprotein [Lysobacter arvi]
MRRIASILAALALAALAGCSSTSQLVTGTPRAPIDPSQVRVYYTPPPGGYEEIARLQTASGSFTYGEQNKLNDVINNLRMEAAKLGANGVLFVGTEDSGGGSSVGVGVGGGSYGGYHGGNFSSGGIGVNISPTKKYAHGVAIHVANPPPMNEPQAPPPAVPPAQPVK